MSCSTLTRTDTLKTGIALPAWGFSEADLQLNGIQSTKQLCEHVYPSSIQLPLFFLQPQCILTYLWVTYTTYGYSDSNSLKDLQKSKSFGGFFLLLFFLPSPPISKISDLATSCESLSSKRQHSTALWDHIFIKRKTSLSTGAKHTHNNWLCT